jgi:hypothetical protein
MSNFMKIRPVGAELLHADGRTDVAKLLVAFQSFAEKRLQIAGETLRFERRK